MQPRAYGPALRPGFRERRDRGHRNEAAFARAVVHPIVLSVKETESRAGWLLCSQEILTYLAQAGIDDELKLLALELALE